MLRDAGRAWVVTSLKENVTSLTTWQIPVSTETNFAVSFSSTRPNLVPVSHPYLQMQQQQFSLTYINNALNTAPFALYPPFFFFFPRTDRVLSPVQPTEIFVFKLHFGEVFQAAHSLRIGSGSMKTVLPAKHPSKSDD